MTKEYDVVILGGGAGGYVAAIRAAQKGLSVAIVEKAQIGGTCLHRGCIPSKAMLRSAEVYRMLKNDASDYGVSTAGVSLQFERVQERKQAIIEQLYGGVQMLMKKGKIIVHEGYGRILGPSIFSPLPGTISVESSTGSENILLNAKNVVIATGTSPCILPNIEVDGFYVMTSDHALSMAQLPQSIMIVGGGVIGVEWASMLVDFGVDVTVLESAPTLLPSEDKEVVAVLTQQLQLRGVKIITNAKVDSTTYTRNDDGVHITADIAGTPQEFSAERMLLSIGREGNLQDIGLENTKIETANGFIQVNDNYQTKEAHIYAIGDVIGGIQLAHVASQEGLAAIEHIATGKTERVKEFSVPRCIYSYPEAARIGYTEEEAKALGYDIKVGKVPFSANGKALVYGETIGFAKVIADKASDDLLGVHLVGPHVTDMISEASLAQLLDATPWEISKAIHPHPTLSEILSEAAMAVDEMAIHQ